MTLKRFMVQVHVCAFWVNFVFFRMKLRVVISVLILIIVGFCLSGNIYASEDNSDVLNTNGEYVLYYTDSCPHCKEVLKFLEEKNIKNSIHLKSVVEFKSEYDAVAKYISSQTGDESIGWPLLVHDGVYKLGSDQIIKYLASEFNVSTDYKDEINPVYIVVGSVVGVVIISFILIKLFKE